MALTLLLCIFSKKTIFAVFLSFTLPEKFFPQEQAIDGPLLKFTAFSNCVIHIHTMFPFHIIYPNRNKSISSSILLRSKH